MKDYCKGCPVLNTSFFSALKGPAKDLVLCLFVYGKYRRRQVLFQEGNPTTRVFALKSGLIKTYKTNADGRVQLIELVRPGETFGLEGLSSKEYSVTAEVLADAEVCFFETARFTALLRDNPDLSREIIRILSGSLLEYRGKMLGFGTKTASSRLASFFLSLLTPGSDGASADISIPLSRGEVADLIGTRLETVSRLLESFRRRKILSVRGKHIRVLDFPKLQASAS